jgi:putative DNA-invertase from lambdoid prophage Rac
MRVGIYARVSTQDQQTLPMQLEAMRTYAMHRGWAITVEIEDVGSGAAERPKRVRLLKAARRREIDAILVWKLDRWGRSMVDLVVSLDELSALGVGFVSLTEALDMTTPSGRALVGMVAVFAQFERDVLKERVKAGIAQARRRGSRHGRPSTTAPRADDIAEMRGAGVSKSEIARQLGLSRSAVRRALANGS